MPAAAASRPSSGPASSTCVVGVGHFAHVVAGSGEVLAAVLTGGLPLSSCATWLAGAVLGDAVGGVVVVALRDDGQVHRAPPASEAVGAAPGG